MPCLCPIVFNVYKTGDGLKLIHGSRLTAEHSNITLLLISVPFSELDFVVGLVCFVYAFAFCLFV